MSSFTQSTQNLIEGSLSPVKCPFNSTDIKQLIFHKFMFLKFFILCLGKSDEELEK